MFLYACKIILTKMAKKQKMRSLSVAIYGTKGCTRLLHLMPSDI